MEERTEVKRRPDGVLQVAYERDGWRVAASIPSSSLGIRTIQAIEVVRIEASADEGTRTGLTAERLAELVDFDLIFESADRYKPQLRAGLLAALSNTPAFADFEAQLSERGRGDSYPDDLYAFVAHSYLQEAAAGGSRGVAVRVARELSDRLGRDVTAAQARYWIYTARKRGFLGATTQGQARPAPGPRLAPWLQHLKNEFDKGEE